MAGFLVVLPVGLAAVAAAARPPSSIERHAEGALVSFSHERRQVTRCTFMKTPGHCDRRTAAVPSRAILTLTPIEDERVLSHSDPRRAVRVELGGQPPTTAVRLGTGRWKLAWQDHAVIARMRVRGGEDFPVMLRTTVGSCARQGDQCRLVTEAIDRVIEIPSQQKDGQ